MARVKFSLELPTEAWVKTGGRLWPGLFHRYQRTAIGRKLFVPVVESDFLVSVVVPRKLSLSSRKRRKAFFNKQEKE